MEDSTNLTSFEVEDSINVLFINQYKNTTKIQLQLTLDHSNMYACRHI